MKASEYEKLKKLLAAGALKMPSWPIPKGIFEPHQLNYLLNGVEHAKQRAQTRFNHALRSGDACG